MPAGRRVGRHEIELRIATAGDHDAIKAFRCVTNPPVPQCRDVAGLIRKSRALLTKPGSWTNGHRVLTLWCGTVLVGVSTIAPTDVLEACEVAVLALHRDWHGALVDEPDGISSAKLSEVFLESTLDHAATELGYTGAMALTRPNNMPPQVLLERFHFTLQAEDPEWRTYYAPLEPGPAYREPF